MHSGCFHFYLALLLLLTGPSQWISIDGFKVSEHLNMLGVLNPELYLLRIIIGEIQNFSKNSWVQMNPLNPLLRGPCDANFFILNTARTKKVHNITT